MAGCPAVLPDKRLRDLHELLGAALGDFIVSRIIRVFPAYWLAIIVTTLVVMLVPGGLEPRKWHDVFVNLTMLQEPLHAPHVDGVYWTLFAELRFYLLLAAMAGGA